MTQIPSSRRPWADLPDHLTEKIWKRLTIFEYLRCGAVCRQWRSIQDSHRRCHAPSPPPMLTLPWFIPRESQREPVDCFTTFPEHEERSDRIRLPLPPCHLSRRNKSKCRRRWHEALPNGWLVLDDLHCEGAYASTLMNPILVNPISGVEIRLPKVKKGLFSVHKLTFSPPPGFVVLLTTETGKNILFREGDEDWAKLEFPEKYMKRAAEISAIVWEGKIYYMHLGRGLMVIDPLPSNPTIELLEMDQSQLSELRHPRSIELFMVESNGKMLLVLEFLDELVFELSFLAFEADFSSKRWTRTESLGDRALLIHQKSAWSLLAADIGVESNCIYFQNPADFNIELDDINIELSQEKSSGERRVRWSVFNLSTRKLSKSPLSRAPTPYTHLMLMPSIS